MRFDEWKERVNLGMGELDKELDAIGMKVAFWRKALWEVSHGLGSSLAKFGGGEVSEKKVRGFMKDLRDVRKEVASSLNRANGSMKQLTADMNVLGDESIEEGGKDEVGFIMVGAMTLLLKSVKILAHVSEMQGYVSGVVDFAGSWSKEQSELDELRDAVLSEMEDARKDLERTVRDEVDDRELEVA